MRWNPGGRSSNLEDRRGASGGGLGGGGFGFGGGGGGGGARLGIGGVIILAILSAVFGRDFVSGAGGDGAPASSVATAERASEGGAIADPTEETLVQFMSAVLDSTQLTWHRLLPGYTDAKLVLFRDATNTACGFGQSASGPFYCPGDQKVYVDLSFFDQLDRQFGAPGDFAQAYVIAHEIGHHVQNLTGTERDLRRAQGQNPGQANALSVAMELQADCYAGVWAHSAAKGGYLDPGDIDEGLGAAAAVGDDRMQKMSTGRVNPESFTHGSSAERKTWFRRGFDTGDPKQCDTFAGR
ncbi:MAG TPA: neutral zinc metallopeptidase [Gemmatimonas sp.]|nr:neutral zinc metallopeptidase [Gemmatimonas sp.]